MLRTRLAFFAAIAAIVTVLTMAPATATAAQDAILTTSLNGSNSVPPHVSVATGSATVFVDADTNNLCVFYRFSGLASAATAAHIHEGAAGTNGPVVIPFPPPPTATHGSAFFCTSAGPEIIANLTTNPSGFYVNIHDSVFPGGDIRGQLANA